MYSASEVNVARRERGAQMSFLDMTMSYFLLHM